MKKIFVFLGIFFHWFWKLLSISSSLVVNLFFLAAVVLLLSLFIQPKVKVPEDSALLLAPVGGLVEKKTVIDPVSRFINGFAGIPLPEETLLQDVLDVIDAAAVDNRIKLIVLDLDNLDGGSLNQYRTIGERLAAFREKGKKVISFGSQFPQGHYYLASYADEIYLNPMGSVNLTGFGVFRLYMKELIDRLAINFHVFKVGSFKSALEPFTRNNMSEEAKEANREWLSSVWELFCRDIAKARNFTPDFLTGYINEMPSYLEQAGGNSAEMSLQNNLVDGLMTRPQAVRHLISLVGRKKNEDSFRHVHFLDYLRTITPSYTETKQGEKRIAVIVARGNIIYGDSVPGQISSEDLAEIIRSAREDTRIQAVVLRINSGGGSAFASEQIRQELLQLKRSGKPVVVSMGALAASGAYWLAADADRIFASPFTLTGSIGIYGMIPTLENAISKIGVASDGIGTTRIAGAGDPTQALPPELSQSMQLSVEEGYERFIKLVAEGRELDIDAVRDIARGRVWDGAKAKEIGLVDELGGLEESVQAAAEMAGLKDYTPVYLHNPVPGNGNFLHYLGWWSQNTLAGLRELALGDMKFARKIRDHLDLMGLQTDPAGIYAHSMIPDSSFYH